MNLKKKLQSWYIYYIYFQFYCITVVAALTKSSDNENSLTIKDIKENNSVSFPLYLYE